MGATQQKQLKPGVQTSEFWLSIATSVTGIAVMLGYLTPLEADELVRAISSVIGGLLTIIATLGYLYGRIALKRTENQNSNDEDSLLTQTRSFTHGELPETYPE